jgi:hypothetical protein
MQVSLRCSYQCCSLLKSETNAKREEGRIASMENAKRLLDSISKAVDLVCKAKMRNECIACFQRGLGATHEMEKNLLAALRKYNIDTIVAPYEADPQLAYLCHIGYCDGVLSEDSDILVYSAVSGVAFPVLCKFDSRTGAVQTVDLKLCGILGNGTDSAGCTGNSNSSGSSGAPDGIENLEDVCFAVGVADKAGASAGKRKPNCGDIQIKNNGSFLSQLQGQFRATISSTSSSSTPNAAGNREISGNITGRRMFVQLCLLAGCDYSDSIPSVGLQTALQVRIASYRAPQRIPHHIAYGRASCADHRALQRHRQ